MRLVQKKIQRRPRASVMGRELSVLWRLAVLLLLVLLDTRDLYFKCQWLGSDDAYRFNSISVERRDSTTQLLQLTANGEEVSTHQQRHSAWRSFLQACEGVDGFQGKYFLHARLRNCTIGANAETSTRVVPQLIMSSGVRADSMAWAACQLLYMHRRPPLCHENIVLEFLRRYAMPYPARIPRSAMLPAMSDAEAEALHLLNVISKSAPLSLIVCAEGFEYNGSKVETHATLFACASPTVVQVAFVGDHATSFAALHRNMAWLTVHDLNLLGLHYVVRQNAVSTFSVLDASDDHQTMTLVHESAVNLSSSGVLYHLLIAVDFVLLVAHTLSALELATLVARRSESLKRSGSDVGKLSTGFLVASLYRSTPIVVLTIVSQIVSWILLLPLSVMLSWSESVASQVHAALAILRVWPLVLLALRTAWSCAVAAQEAFAYQLVRRTYVSVFEVIAATALAILLLRPQLLSIREKKYTLDKQRLVDTTTFNGAAVVSNAYHDEPDFFPLASRASTVSLLYVPLTHVVLLSLGFISIVLAVRYVYVTRQQRLSTNSCDAGPGGPYARLPAEELLNTPIRAEHLVRSRLPLETITPNQKWLQPEQYLEHGVVLEDGKYLRTRQGFLGVAKPKIHIDDDHDAVGGRGHLDGSVGDDRDTGAHVKQEDPSSADSPTKKRRMSAHVPSLR